MHIRKQTNIHSRLDDNSQYIKDNVNIVYLLLLNGLNENIVVYLYTHKYAMFKRSPPDVVFSYRNTSLFKGITHVFFINIFINIGILPLCTEP